MARFASKSPDVLSLNADDAVEMFKKIAREVLMEEIDPEPETPATDEVMSWGDAGVRVLPHNVVVARESISSEMAMEFDR